MKQKKAVIIFLVLSLLAPCGLITSVWAGEGSRGGTFLPLGWDAEGEGMAGAATLLIRNDASSYWNPANLCFMTARRAMVNTTKPVPGMPASYSTFSIGTSMLGSRIFRGDKTNISRAGAALSVSHLDLDLAEGSAWNESTAGFSGAYSINHYNSLGVTFRILRGWNDLDNADCSGMALNIGWTARLREKLWFGIVGRNIYSKISYPARSENIGPSWNIALSRNDIYGRVSAEFDLVLKEGEINRVLTGTRIILFKDLMSVLGGIDRRLANGKRTIIHFGFLTHYKSADISISFKLDPEDAFDKQTYLSIGYTI
ncbi:MAG: hypothetical protein U5O15_01115 [Candidatus Krumholzibacteriota bacterium]|nr:hypothetical protein [Candidatus Krumholzibacteriota bacterium]